MATRTTVYEQPTNVRWAILALLFVISFVAYLLRMNISVAAKFMMPELGLSEIQMGWVFAAFVWGYALFQIPGGIFGEILGPRRALSIVVLIWAILTVLTGLIPGQIFTGAGGALVSLLVLRFLMGVVQAPLYPVTAGTVQQWFPVGSWALPNGLSSMGLGLGAAFTPPLVAWVMVTVGWRETFYVTAPVALILIAAWWWYVRDSPRQHSKVSPAELGVIETGRLEEVDVPEAGVLKRLVKNHNIWLLTLSYLCMNYVFYIFFTWFYIYLVDVKGFGLLEGGFFASLPFIAGSLAAAVGGWTCDHLCRRIGPRWGCRLPGIAGMLLVALFLVLGALATNAMLAVVLLSICFASTQFTEGAYWAGATYIGGRHTSAATGVLNTGGNLGGVISAPLIPILVDQFGWLIALSTGSVFALLGAALWLWVRADEPLVGSSDLPRLSSDQV